MSVVRDTLTYTITTTIRLHSWAVGYTVTYTVWEIWTESVHRW